MLKLYNTMARKKEVFEPRNDRVVKMFTCGPSIYGRPHVGNYRSFLWEDVLQRYLGFLGYRVERVLNFTDVEDKAIAEAEKTRMTIEDLTAANAEQFFADARDLRIELPNHIPRSSTSVDQAVKLIQILLGKGYAYWYGKDVFFDPLKFNGFGKLFRLDMSRWPKEKKRFKKDTYPGRRWNLGDFILWHGYKPGDKVYWDTGIGKGRPSWNIQDPAMITETLGYTVDISCGGIDNLYRHHDYNIAVIEAVSGEEFSRYWIHGEHLLVDGKKMSKSVGNIIYPQDLMKEGYSARSIRFYLLYGHHREPLNLTKKIFEKTTQKLVLLNGLVEKLSSGDSGGSRARKTDSSVEALIDRLIPDFERNMNDDLNIKGAFDATFENLSQLVSLKVDGKVTGKQCEKIRKELIRIDKVFQFILQ
ncbi:class I tRNA ligase family protein [Desulforhabdus amnigena]|jgi:cysteinyl-tRNA synthetase|uniref:Cysteine--tRNA ligase n=1 Tax=Desulforhabdus amnigena TaxID=40218 RepID=A0A9W6D1G7_9BACT|nr:class I tRNA ligase family protein [Desulforhabdus amnigena]NLJ29345.1 class I tRNA ligase family protein [Deltaproteobacteria bacterium]GLI34387.1 cysteine--tRNA ligase [Desulforhabdus amnigena]